jgi:hypothetical protein
MSKHKLALSSYCTKPDGLPSGFFYSRKVSFFGIDRLSVRRTIGAASRSLIRLGTLRRLYCATGVGTTHR